MKYKFIIVFFFVTLNSILAQNKTILIKDKTTNEPIYLAAIANQKGNGTYSNEDGSFDLSISQNDTLFISHLSYQKVVLPKKEIDNLKNSIIYLTPKVIELAETVVRPVKPTKKMLGYYKEETFFKRWGPGGKNDFSVFVNHVKNPTGELGYVNKLFFDLHVDLSEGGKSSKARIRMFSVGADGLPKDDILIKEIIKTIDVISPNLKIDVSDLKINFPPEGVFIGLEFFCNFELKNLKKTGYSKVITNCPHVPSAKVINFNETGKSYFWTLTQGKFQWTCVSDGNGAKFKGWLGQVFKFGAEVTQ
jgi:hypothetical protein